MTPKEKAIELVDKFKFETKQSEIINDIILGDVSVIFQHHKAKQCALIAVDEIIDANKKCSYTIDYTNTLHAKDLDAKVRSEIELFFIYWESVKQEIEKL